MDRLKNVFLLSFGCLCFFTGCSRHEKHSGELSGSDQVTNDLPGLVLVTADSSQVSVRQLKGKTILVVFQPDCEHCQREAGQINKHIAAFENYQLYFISSSPMEEIRQFASDYAFSRLPNVHFGWAPTASITNNFGSISAPSMYIYDLNGKIVRIFNGETDIHEILKVI